ncbi:MAG TPA: glycosyltransferase [Pyrinomonadaceae bacterium]|nr:glycosyltransferase [Pyrinomonadaceae bacterium]
MKVSVVIPARNEEHSIAALIEGLLGQTRPPEEVVVCDNGSTDATAAVVESYVGRGAQVRLVRSGPGLPGRGRNLAAAQAAHDWLAFIDAGIRPAPDWLAELVSRAESSPEVEVVYGAWEPVTDSFFKECAAIAYVPPPAEFEGTRMRPRSIASSLMRREVWLRAGGFPEHLRSAEDLLFMNEVERAGARTAYAPRAVVRWDIQPNLWRTFRRFVAYSRHNIRAGLWRDWQAAILRRYALLAAAALPAFAFGARWVVAGLWLLMLAARGAAALRRQRRAFPAGVGRNLLRLCVLVPLIAALDAAALAGSVSWLLLDKLNLARRGAAEVAR